MACRDPQRYRILHAYTSSDTNIPASDQESGLPMPPIERPPQSSEQVIALPPPAETPLAVESLRTLLTQRKSRRLFTEKPLSLAQLSFLAWAHHGLREQKEGRVFRTVPSAGNRHPFDTWLAIFHVEGLVPGLYRYLPLTHSLALVRTVENLGDQLTALALNQKFAGKCAVNFIITALPYRSEWRYVRRTEKIVATDAGYLNQNLYLACEALGLGTCAIGAFDQHAADALLGVDGTEEFVFLMSPVGHPA